MKIHELYAKQDNYDNFLQSMEIVNKILGHDQKENENNSENGKKLTTIENIHNSYKNGTKTPTDIANQLIANYKKLSHLNIFLQFKPEDLLNQANESTSRWKQNKPLSILDGIPVTVKDQFNVYNHNRTDGTQFRGKKIGVISNQSAEDLIIKRLRKLGAMIVGKVHMSEIGIQPIGYNVWNGTCKNPYSVKCIHNTGGSSSGCGASVASQLVPLSIGADAGGSIRTPASHNGIYGLKATFGRIPLGTIFHSNCWSVVHVGCLGNTLKDEIIGYMAVAGMITKDEIMEEVGSAGKKDGVNSSGDTEIKMPNYDSDNDNNKSISTQLAMEMVATLSDDQNNYHEQQDHKHDDNKANAYEHDVNDELKLNANGSLKLRSIASFATMNMNNMPLKHLYNVNNSNLNDKIVIGVYWDWINHSQDEMKNECKKVIDTLNNKFDFIEIKEIVLPHLDIVSKAHGVNTLSEMITIDMKYLNKEYNKKKKWTFGDSTQLMMLFAKTYKNSDFVGAQIVRTWILDYLDNNIFNECNIIITPACGMVSEAYIKNSSNPSGQGLDIFDSDLLSKLLRYATLANFTGIPAISIPVNYTNVDGSGNKLDDGTMLPVSIQLMANHWNEHILFRLANIIDLNILKRQLPPEANRAVYNL